MQGAALLEEVQTHAAEKAVQWSAWTEARAGQEGGELPPRDGRLTADAARPVSSSPKGCGWEVLRSSWAEATVAAS